MGMNLSFVLYLQRQGHLTAAKNALFDLGPQSVFRTTVEQISAVIRNQGREPPQLAELARLAESSGPTGGELPFFSEIADYAGINYRAIDICAAPNTDILDLNFDELPAEHRARYDVVLNFGTTEHVVNQFSAFRVMHDAAKVGGVIYCQLPATGYFDHGYFCYTPLFFDDLAKANGYNALDRFFTVAGQSNVKSLGIDVRVEDEPANVRPIADAETELTFFNFHVLLQKTSADSFQIGLEIGTSPGSVDSRIAVRYGNTAVLADLQNRLKAMEQSRSWRVTAPLRALARQLHR